jgi:RNA polymerase sigma factor (sigma-70 family)
MGTSSPAPTAAALRGDEAQLFRTHHRTLLRLVARDVCARPHVTEDACGSPGSSSSPASPSAPAPWAGCASSPATRRSGSPPTSGAARCSIATILTGAPTEPASARLDAVEALRALAALPPRKRTVLALQVSGRSYQEIGRLLDMTPRTVERQVLRARAAARRGRDGAAWAA